MFDSSQEAADAAGEETGVCSPGHFRCTGDDLEACAADGADWHKVVTCAAGLCDAAHGRCNVCSPSATKCKSASTLTTCAADGQSQTDDPCGATTPFCDTVGGADACVACLASTDCPGATDECSIPTCNAGACGTQPVAQGIACGVPGSGGKCDGAGQCVYCTPVRSPFARFTT